MNQSDEKNNAVIKIQDWGKLCISRRKTRDFSRLHLRTSLFPVEQAHESIDIDKRSKENLRNLKDRVLKDRKGKFSEQELTLFKVLLDKKYLLAHTTSAPLLESILKQSNPSLLDPEEARRRNISSQTSTPSFLGVDNNVFFGLAGSRLHSLPTFTRQRMNQKTNTREDYATVHVDLVEYLHEYPHSGIWSSGNHGYYQGSLIADYPSPSVMLGTTKFYLTYKLEGDLFELESCRYTCVQTFIHEDGQKREHCMEIGDDIAAGNDIIPYIAYSFIEKLDFIGGSVKKYLLVHPNDENLINLLIDKLFFVEHFEIHIPTKLALNKPYVTYFLPKNRKDRTQLVNQAATQGNIEELENLKKLDDPLDGYMYLDPYFYDDSPPLDLPLVVAIQANQRETIEWLIINGANKASFNNQYNSISTSIYEVGIQMVRESLLIAQAALYKTELQWIQLLEKYGFMLNFYIEAPVKNYFMSTLYKQIAKMKYKDFDRVHSDEVFLRLLRGVSFHKNFELLEYCMKKMLYCQKEDFYQNRLYRDIARVGDKDIFIYFQEKNPFEVNYSILFNLSIIYCNVSMQDYLTPFVSHLFPKDNIDSEPSQAKNSNWQVLLVCHSAGDTNALIEAAQVLSQDKKVHILSIGAVAKKTLSNLSQNRNITLAHADEILVGYPNNYEEGEFTAEQLQLLKYYFESLDIERVVIGTPSKPYATTYLQIAEYFSSNPKILFKAILNDYLFEDPEHSYWLKCRLLAEQPATLLWLFNYYWLVPVSEVANRIHRISPQLKTSIVGHTIFHQISTINIPNIRGQLNFQTDESFLFFSGSKSENDDLELLQEIFTHMQSDAYPCTKIIIGLHPGMTDMLLYLKQLSSLIECYNLTGRVKYILSDTMLNSIGGVIINERDAIRANINGNDAAKASHGVASVLPATLANQAYLDNLPVYIARDIKKAYLFSGGQDSLEDFLSKVERRSENTQSNKDKQNIPIGDAIARILSYR